MTSPSDKSDKNEKVDPADMVGIPIEEFISGNSLPVAIYIKLSDTKFVKVAHQGSQTRIESLANYQNKKVDKLWVKRSDYNKVTELHIKLVEVVGNMAASSTAQKTDVISKATKAVFDQIYEMGIDENLYFAAKRITDVTVKIVEGEEDLAKLMASLNSISDDFIRHSMAVSAFSVMIAAALGWEKDEVLQKLAIGGLLHDVGKKMINPELLKKPKSKYSKEEMAEYETHAFKGMQMLTGIATIPRDVVSMVYEHHENSLAQGFPQKFRDYRINPFARIAALANTFAELTIKNIDHPTVRTPSDAIVHIEQRMGQPFNKDVFKAFRNFIIPPPDKDAKKVS